LVFLLVHLLKLLKLDVAMQS